MNTQQIHITVSTELKAKLLAASALKYPDFHGRSLATWCRNVLEQAATAELNNQEVNHD